MYIKNIQFEISTQQFFLNLKKKFRQKYLYTTGLLNIKLSKAFYLTANPVIRNLILLYNHSK